MDNGQKNTCLQHVFATLGAIQIGRQAATRVYSKKTMLNAIVLLSIACAIAIAVLLLVAHYRAIQKYAHIPGDMQFLLPPIANYLQRFFSFKYSKQVPFNYL